MSQSTAIQGLMLKNWACPCVCLMACVTGFAQTSSAQFDATLQQQTATITLPLENLAPAITPERLNENAYPEVAMRTLTPAQSSELARLRTLAQIKTTGIAPPQRAARVPIQATTSAEAAWILGLLSLHGVAMPIDKNQAKKWFQQAAGQGLLLAHAGLAWCTIEECSAPSDPRGAQASIELLRQVNAPRALYLEWLTLTRRIRKSQASEPKTLMQSTPDSGSSASPLPYKTLILQAAQLGDVQAQIELGIDCASQMQLKESLAYFNAAAHASHVAVGNAQIITERIERATHLETSTASHSPQANASSLLKQARQLHRGEGVPANFTEAIRLYRMAANAGSKEAQKMLQLIYARPAADGQVDVTWMQQLQDVDLASPVPQPSEPAPAFWLRREPTALYDLLPPMWRLLK